MDPIGSDVGGSPAYFCSMCLSGLRIARGLVTIWEVVLLTERLTPSMTMHTLTGNARRTERGRGRECDYRCSPERLHRAT
jgi:hypothetical protein